MPQGGCIQLQVVPNEVTQHLEHSTCEGRWEGRGRGEGKGGAFTKVKFEVRYKLPVHSGYNYRQFITVLNR